MPENKKTNTGGEPCYLPENCHKPECQDKIVARHSITETALRVMMQAFNVSVSAPKIFPAISIATEINNVNCSSWVVALGGDWQVTDNNDDICFGVENRAYNLAKIDYSIALFAGMLRLYNPDTVHFYKARHTNGDFTIVFQALKNGVIVYCGNRNDETP